MAFNNLNVESLKVFLGIAADDSSQDPIIQVYIDGALSALQEISGRNLVRGWYRDTLAGLPDRLYLREFPVRSLISIQLAGADLPTTDYQLFLESGYIHFKNFYFPRYSIEIPQQFLVVDYIGGYETLPGKYLLALYSAIQAAYTHRSQVTSYGGTVKRISVYDVGVTDFAVNKSSNAIMRETIVDQLGDQLLGAPAIGGWMLHECEFISEVPGSPE